MTTSHLKMEVETTPETLGILNIPQTKDNAQHRVIVMIQPLSKNFSAS
jgi:hypothetical protein